jgi:hypothetical protein
MVTQRSTLQTRAFSLLLVSVALVLAACGDNPDSSPGAESTSGISPNLWTWKATHLGRTHHAFALFDHRNDPPSLVVGHVPWASNIRASHYTFEVQTLGGTLHLKSLGSFQPHANCIQGDFEFSVTTCETDTEFELCGALIDLESGHEVKMYSFPGFDVVVPEEWEWEYSADDTLGEELDDYIDLSPMLDRVTDEHYRKDRARATSRFLRGAFEVRAQVPARVQEPRVKARQCVDSGRGIVRALTGKDSSQFISRDLPASGQ